MRKVFIPVLVILFALVGCGKKDTTTTTATDPQPNVKFTCLGINYNISGSLATNATVGGIIKKTTLENTKPGYEISVQNGSTFGLFLNVMTSTDLAVTTYTYTFPSANLPRFGNIYGVGTTSQFVAGYGAGDFVTVNVTKISNGYASGTFSAKMTAFNSLNNRVDITNGVFTDLKILN